MNVWRPFGEELQCRCPRRARPRIVDPSPSNRRRGCRRGASRRMRLPAAGGSTAQGPSTSDSSIGGPGATVTAGKTPASSAPVSTTASSVPLATTTAPVTSPTTTRRGSGAGGRRGPGGKMEGHGGQRDGSGHRTDSVHERVQRAAATGFRVRARHHQSHLRGARLRRVRPGYRLHLPRERRGRARGPSGARNSSAADRGSGCGGRGRDGVRRPRLRSEYRRDGGGRVALAPASSPEAAVLFATR